MLEPMGPELFLRLDETHDELFYVSPRLVVHIDDGAIAAVGQIFSERLPRGGVLLDLMSSWRSHLPGTFKGKVVGLGLNRKEMEENPALDEVVVHNLNREPRLPFGENSFDGAMLTVSVQYLIRPVEVFADVGRVLKAGAPFVVSFSNRMFPTKAIAAWTQADEPERVELVSYYFRASNAFERVEAIDRSNREGPPSDPMYAVVGYRS